MSGSTHLDTELLSPAGSGVAFLGCGEAADMHSRTLARLEPGLRRYYASRDIARARSYQQRHRGVGALEGYAAALEHPEVDVVVVLTPPVSHLEWTLAALAAGKHVIVEKPPFLRSSDFDLVVEAARQARRQVLVAENYPYKPLARALTSLVQDRALGALRIAQINAVKQQASGGWRADPALAGGGALFEGGIHWVSLLTEIDPAVASIQAEVPDPEEGHERTVIVTLRWESGALATLAYSWEAYSPLKGVRLSRLYGDQGSAVFESNGLFLAAWGRRGRLRIPGLRDLRGQRAMFTDFLRALREGRSPRYDLSRARRDLELVEEAYRSAGLASAEGAGPTTENT
jgi:predicted dehydrogenase